MFLHKLNYSMTFESLLEDAVNIEPLLKQNKDDCVECVNKASAGIKTITKLDLLDMNSGR